MLNYFERIYAARYFWWSLVKAELRNKYRRSTLGLLWSLLYPFLVTLLLVYVLGSIFKTNILDLIPFIYSGFIVWDVISGSFLYGAGGIINSEAYIKQFSHPLAIYSLKQTLVLIINALISGIGVFAWCAVVKPQNIPYMILTLPITILLLFLFSWSVTTLSGIINTKFRDFQQMIGLIIQALWFISPVYFETKVFINANLGYLVYYNPIARIMNLVRAPFIDGTPATGTDYLFVIGTVAVFFVIDIFLIKRNEKELIFYI
ncbi:MAG TPA: ABC transporter permease [Clostridia bacterium]|nr:ABC transporter permease [Clostridia bacterium]